MTEYSQTAEVRQAIQDYKDSLQFSLTAFAFVNLVIGFGIGFLLGYFLK